MSYVSKVTSAGQITLPKKVRDALGVGPDSYIVLTAMGETVVLRKMDADQDTLKKIREKVRKTGLTRERVEEIVEEERSKLRKETDEKGLR
jgi:antitoxin PrlF